MLAFPQTTAFGKKVPKQKFYDHAEIPAAIRRMFIAEIESIVWANKLSPATLNVEQGRTVTEIELLRLVLRQKSLSKPLQEIITAAIPYHLVFLLEYGDEFQLRVSYAPPNGRRLWYATQWQAQADLSLRIQGLNLDEIHENFVRQIAGGKLAAGEALQADVEREQARLALQKRIAALARKMRAAKQFNRQAELNRQLRAARAALGALTNADGKTAC